MTPLPTHSFSHLALTVHDLAGMRAWYTQVLGFTVTDEGRAGASGHLVFMSRDPRDHHQIVMGEGREGEAVAPALNHFALRYRDLADLRALLGRLQAAGAEPIAPVTHGNTWSLYFHDPEGNRIECFVDTPWHTPQPFGERLDFSKSDTELRAFAEALCRDRPGFQLREDWLRDQEARFASAQ